MSRTRLPATALALLALTATACGTDTGSNAGSDGTVKPDLAVTGIDWAVESVTVDGRKIPAPEGTRVTIDDKGRASGNSGCNSFGAEATVKGDTITVGTVQSTEMACEKDIQKFEGSLQAAFTGKLKGKVADDRLTLTTAKGDSIAMSAKPQEPNAKLTETRWNVESLIKGKSVTSLPSDTAGKAELIFGKDGSVGGSTSCNNLSGKAAVAGSTITFSKVATTRKMCTPEAMRTERELLKILDGRTNYEIKGSTLSLTAAAGDGLEARAAKQK
ncbi:META domain-containing protein [Streptomyces sp. H27-C3]|uniref:META domain-containing protein n=1 Tax=Streptomyces sp. H27-C3 TaxID=3046305 RepID=UPI0024B9D9BF|nr:META domain-containing protein [Streptomyces sp. H27-C3]MDJ0463511.1 META domain-containing protein [Streptomyces sp. H27-C3]